MADKGSALDVDRRTPGRITFGARAMEEHTATVCPGCGLRISRRAGPREPEAGASAECLSLKDELSFYTLSRGDAFFIHQLLVDAYAAQHATADSKPITTAFALIGLYLFVERGFSGKNVQRAHVRLAKRRRRWPRFQSPESRGALTVADVLRARSEDARDQAIKQWARSVWAAWNKKRVQIASLADLLG